MCPRLWSLSLESPQSYSQVTLVGRLTFTESTASNMSKLVRRIRLTVFFRPFRRMTTLRPKARRRRLAGPARAAKAVKVRATNEP